MKLVMYKGLTIYANPRGGATTYVVGGLKEHATKFAHCPSEPH